MNNQFSIDPHKLEEEWMLQPILYEKYAEEAREAEIAYQQTKEELEYIKAQLDGQIRNAPESFGISKITEAAVSNAVILSLTYKDQNNLLLERKAELLRTKNNIATLEQKKSALEGLVSLWKGQYFSIPKEGIITEGGKRFLEHVEEKKTEVSNDIRKKFSIKRK